MISSAKLQRIAEIVMVLGIVALCQPWNLFLHRYGVAIILIGLLVALWRAARLRTYLGRRATAGT